MVARWGGVLKGTTAGGGGGGGGGVVAFAGSFVDSDFASNNATQYTFSNLSFGVAAANRLLIVGCGPNLPSSVVIGGVTATLVKNLTNGNASASIWQALVPSGTTGSVVINLSATPFHGYGMGLHRITTDTQGATNTGSDSATGTDLTLSTAATVPASGYGVVCVVAFDSGGAGCTVSSVNNYTEDYEVDASVEVMVEGGHLSTSATITAILTGNNNEINFSTLVYASWGP